MLDFGILATYFWSKLCLLALETPSYRNANKVIFNLLCSLSQFWDFVEVEFFPRLASWRWPAAFWALHLTHYRQLNADSRARDFFLPFFPIAAQSSYVNCEILLSYFRFPQLIFQVNSLNQNNSILTSSESGRNSAEVLQKQKAGNNLGFFSSSFPAFDWKDPGVFSAVGLVFFQHLSFLLESFKLFAWFFSTLFEDFRLQNFIYRNWLFKPL